MVPFPATMTVSLVGRNAATTVRRRESMVIVQAPVPGHSGTLHEANCAPETVFGVSVTVDPGATGYLQSRPSGWLVSQSPPGETVTAPAIPVTATWSVAFGRKTAETCASTLFVRRVHVGSKSEVRH